MRNLRSLTRYVRRYSDSEIKYEAFRSLASGWIGRISQFPQLTRYFCDPDLPDDFIDNALPVALDFQHNAVIIYGLNPMIAEILRRKNQKVSNSCREQL